MMNTALLPPLIHLLDKDTEVRTAVAALARQLDDLPTAATARAALAGGGGARLVGTWRNLSPGYSTSRC